MQIKTIMRYHFTSTRIAIIKKIATSIGGDVEKLKHSYIVGGNVNGAATFKNSLMAPQKVKHRVTM